LLTVISFSISHAFFILYKAYNSMHSLRPGGLSRLLLFRLSEEACSIVHCHYISLRLYKTIAIGNKIQAL
jgi:hypothetical protein